MIDLDIPETLSHMNQQRIGSVTEFLHSFTSNDLKSKSVKEVRHQFVLFFSVLQAKSENAVEMLLY